MLPLCGGQNRVSPIVLLKVESFCAVSFLKSGKISRKFLFCILNSEWLSFLKVQVLERDLAVFGFFATLGRSTRAYLAAKGVPDSEESLASLLRSVACWLSNIKD